MNKNVLRALSYGMYAVSVNDEGRATGCIANSIMQVTYDTVAVSINHENYTNECLKKSKKFAISILGEDTEMNTIAFLGFQSGRNKNKFEQIETVTVNDLSIIKDSVGYLICETLNTFETETHTVFIAKITDGELLDKTKIPMTYDYYHKVKKGNSPKNAPTYISE